MQAEGGCQMCLSAVKLDHSGKLFWDTPSWLSAWVSVFEPGAWIWINGFRRYLHMVKNWSGYFSFNSTRVRALGWPLLGNFFFSGFFWFFWRGSVGQIIYREYIVFRGSNISCSLARVWCIPEPEKGGSKTSRIAVSLDLVSPLRPKYSWEREATVARALARKTQNR